MGIGYCWLNRLVSDFLYKKENGDLKMDVSKIIGLIGTIGVIRGAFLAYEGWRIFTCCNSVPWMGFKIWNHDAFYFDIPLDADCIFLFNPFDATIMSGVVKNIELSLKKNKRKITFHRR